MQPRWRSGLGAPGVAQPEVGAQETGVVERAGYLALIEQGHWLDQVHERTGASLLARRPWLQAWADAFSMWEPWVLALVDQGEARAVAPLARRRVGSGVQVVSVGHDALGESPLAAADDAAADELAAAIVAALNGLGSPWTLYLRQLPVGSHLTEALLERLPSTTVFTGSPRPVLRFADRRPPRQWLSRNIASALAKAQNRIGREAHRAEVDWVEPWSQIENLLPELVSVHRARDVELRGATLLDEELEARFYRQVIDRHAGYWRLLAVRIDESLAGYALCLQDGGTLRVWDNRVAPHWGRYSAGLIANAELVMRAAADPSISELDWGAGEQRYKLSLSNEVVGAEAVKAWSSRMLRAALASRRKLTQR